MIYNLLKIKKKILLLLCTFLLLSTVFLNIKAKEEVVKVGYIIRESFQEGEEGEIKSGYGYDYLQKIATYTNWHYEYVYGSFNELLTKLENGEIDIMGSITKTEERNKNMIYGNHPQGTEDFYLIIQSRFSLIDPNDLKTLNHKKIGVIKKAVEKDILINYLDDNSLYDAQIIEFDTYDECYAAFDKNEVDAIVDSFEVLRDSWIRIVKIGSTQVYFGLNKNRPDLKAQLDYAQKEILINEPNYNDELITSYIFNNQSYRPLSMNERTWVKDNPLIKVGYTKDSIPYIFSVDNQIKGMYYKIFELLKQRYRIDSTFVEYDDYHILLNDLNEGIINCAVPMFYNYHTAEENNVLISSKITSIPIISITSGDNKNITSIATSIKGPIQEYYDKVYFSNMDIIYYGTRRDALKAVQDGTADITHVSTEWFNNNIKKEDTFIKLNISNSKDAPICIGVSRKSANLLPIINKLLTGISDTQIADMIIEGTKASNYNLTFINFIKRNKFATIISATSVFLVILILTIALCNGFKKRKQLYKKNQELEKLLQEYSKADAERRRDFLTGLKNRQDLYEMFQKVANKELPSIESMYMIDIDNYKLFNDNYGHSKGDEILKLISDILIKYAKIHNLHAYRYGGEEMLIVCFDRAIKPEVMANEIVKIIYDLDIQREDTIFKRVTISVGYTSNNEQFDRMIDLCDEAMYEAKRQGRNRAIRNQRDNIHE